VDQLSGNALIEISNLQKVFRENGNELLTLDQLNLDVPDGKFTVLIGPSGCGKSTLLYMLAGFEQPTAGEILMEGKSIKKPGPDRGFVFQDYALFPWKTVLGNVMFGLLNTGWDKKEAETKAREFITLVNLKGFEDAYPHTLSGGMKQRVAIARALAYNPKVLLMDEPFGALDSQTRKHMQRELERIWQMAQKTVVFVTHSVIEAVYLADRIVILTARPGRVKGIVDVNVPRPRNYTDDAYLDIREEVLSLLEEEVEKEVQMDGV
jgi:NitT/TauT family transport system ATP-binding protein